MRNTLTGQTPASSNHTIILSKTLCSTKENNRSDHWGLSSEKQRLGPHIVQLDPECPPSVTAGCQPVKREQLERVHQKQGLKFGFERDSKSHKLGPTLPVLSCRLIKVIISGCQDNARNSQTEHLADCGPSEQTPTSGGNVQHLPHKAKQTCGLQNIERQVSYATWLEWKETFF